jgi:Fe-S-cluster containining protein
MSDNPLFDRYEDLVARADEAFERISGDYPACVSCKPGCADCCHAVFGLFLIEAAYLRRQFRLLPRKERDAALARGDLTEKDLERLSQRLETFKDDPRMQSYTMARERVRCPLLDDGDRCILYAHRPITCRVYGIPTSIQGKAHVCNKSRFQGKQSYPTFNLDVAHRELYLLSGELLAANGQMDPEKASLLISVSKAIRTPLQDLIIEGLE